MRKLALALVMAFGGLFVTATPTQAATRFTFDAGPEPAIWDYPTVLKGRALDSSARSRDVTIEFSFRVSGQKKYRYRGFAHTDARGNYSKKLYQTVSGTWRATMVLGAGTTRAVRYDFVKMKPFSNY
ncbi:MAG: hypothetical protein EPO57_09215 [Chitinophagaceae bacterium]|nr:MAG: hypothetical protein EPO57_09215 [Chitinophagaceae bacterium]